MFTLLITAAKRLSRELRARRELRELLEKDDRILRDIGLNRAEVEWELMRPLTLGDRHEGPFLSRLAFYIDGGLFAPRR
jgi:uncharacterized protein YjiS (DUF1127 family)